MTSRPSRRSDHLTSADLSIVRRNCDRGALVAWLDLRISERRENGEWWGFSPFAEEKTPSFHIRADGSWYDFSTGQGGGFLELVQRLRGVDCYAAARLLLDNGVSSIVAGTRKETSAALETPPPALSDAEEAPRENQPIRVDLRRLLVPEHPEFMRRGLTAEVLRELGAGYLPPEARRRTDGLSGRLVFQVRGLREKDGKLESVILAHLGRATTPEQEEEAKWWFHHGFRSSQELFHLDRVVLDLEAAEQARERRQVVLVEGCFDTAKLWAAGIKNVVASFGSHLSQRQLPRLELLREHLGVESVRVFYDRDQTGSDPQKQGFAKAQALLESAGFGVVCFDWNARFQSPKRGEVAIPESISDPAEFSVEQLRWLRSTCLV